jgi:hypothetical protein
VAPCHAKADDAKTHRGLDAVPLAGPLCPQMNGSLSIFGICRGIIR